MKIKKSLTNIALTATLALGITSCSTLNHHYEKPNGTRVHFSATLLDNQNHIEAREEDGTKIFYHDTNNDFKLDKLYIEKDKQRTEYKNDIIGKPFLEKAQTQYEIYLKQILEPTNQLD